MKKIALLIVCLGFIPAVFGDTPDPVSSKKEKEEVEPPAPEHLKQEKKGETLISDLHFAMGVDAYDKGDKEAAAKHWEIAALSGNNPDAYYNCGYALHDLASMKGDEALFWKSIDKFAEAVRLKPDYHKAYNNWGIALTDLARMKWDEALFEKAFTKYEKAVDIKPDFHETYFNWGNALSLLAKLKKDEALFQEAFEKYAEAVRIKPDLHEAYSNWGFMLRDCAKIVEDEAESVSLLKQAMEKMEKAEEIKKRK